MVSTHIKCWNQGRCRDPQGEKKNTHRHSRYSPELPPLIVNWSSPHRGQPSLEAPLPIDFAPPIISVDRGSLPRRVGQTAAAGRRGRGEKGEKL